MAVGGPILIIIVGAILRWAINVQSWWWAAHGWWISVPALGDILLIGGFIWLAIVIGLEVSRRAQARQREAQQREYQQQRDAQQREYEEQREAQERQRLEQRDAQERQRMEDEWRQARELERARSVQRMAQRAAAGRRRRDDDDEDA
jgi:uncharacterized membrane protein YhiD involved in acid resistance